MTDDSDDSIFEGIFDTVEPDDMEDFDAPTKLEDFTLYGQIDAATPDLSSHLADLEDIGPTSMETFSGEIDDVSITFDAKTVDELDTTFEDLASLSTKTTDRLERFNVDSERRITCYTESEFINGVGYTIIHGRLSLNVPETTRCNTPIDEVRNKGCYKTVQRAVERYPTEDRWLFCPDCFDVEEHICHWD